MRCWSRSAYSRAMNPIMAAAMTADPTMFPTVLSRPQNRRAAPSATIVGNTIARQIGHHRMDTIVRATLGYFQPVGRRGEGAGRTGFSGGVAVPSAAAL